METASSSEMLVTIYMDVTSQKIVIITVTAAGTSNTFLIKKQLGVYWRIIFKRLFYPRICQQRLTKPITGLWAVIRTWELVKWEATVMSGWEKW
jgi:hypothetical protein